ncbi:MAG: DUF2085 domain-containing protein [candidate division WOR-3 bacterium]
MGYNLSLHKIVEIAFFLCGAVCHQLPAHSLHPGGHQLPLCARCTGIHFGLWAGFYFLLVLRRRKLGIVPNWKVAIAIAVSLAIMAGDVLTGLQGWQAAANERRLATGLLTGYSLALLMGPVLAGINRNEATKSNLGWADLGLGAFLVACLWPLLFYTPGWMSYPLTIFEGLSVIGAYAVVWGVLIAYTTFAARNRPIPWWLWIGGGVIVSLIQAVLMGALRIRLGI